MTKRQRRRMSRTPSSLFFLFPPKSEIKNLKFRKRSDFWRFSVAKIEKKRRKLTRFIDWVFIV
jgi:hypothetical protein